MVREENVVAAAAQRCRVAGLPCSRTSAEPPLLTLAENKAQVLATEVCAAFWRLRLLASAERGGAASLGVGEQRKSGGAGGGSGSRCTCGWRARSVALERLQ